jgi:enoyl-CoA hydratase/carnithine racemase
MADAVEAMSAVTVVRLHGHCVGGAVVLAAACDLRLAASDTSFSIPELDLGIPLAWGGIPRLVREIGPALTKELVMTCRPFSAAEAKAAGLVNRVVDGAALDDAVESLVASLLTKSGLTLRVTKRHVDAVTAQMVGMAQSWADADGLVTAFGDSESRQTAAAYLQRVRKR